MWARVAPKACGVCAIVPLTRQFTIEYSVLFDATPTALERLRLPVPLGGTANLALHALVRAVCWLSWRVVSG